MILIGIALTHNSLLAEQRDEIKNRAINSVLPASTNV
jgi:hypothetical protein